MCVLNFTEFNTKLFTADDNLTKFIKVINVTIFGLAPNNIISAFIVIKCSGFGSWMITCPTTVLPPAGHPGPLQAEL